MQGPAAGSVFGAVFGFVLGAFSWVEPLVSGLALATYGFLVGLLLGARRRRPRRPLGIGGAP